MTYVDPVTITPEVELAALREENAKLLGLLALAEPYVESAWFRAGNNSGTYAAKTILDGIRAALQRAKE